MSGKRVTFIGDAMITVVQGVIEVRTLIGQPPVVVGDVAVLSRLSNPYRTTVDLDVVDRLLGEVPQLEVLRAADGAERPPTSRTRSSEQRASASKSPRSWQSRGRWWL